MQKVPFFSRVNSSPTEGQSSSNGFPIHSKQYNQLYKGPSGISSRDQMLDHNNLIVTNTPSHQMLQINQQNKPKTSSVTQRVHIVHNPDRQNEGGGNEGVGKSPLKLKLHNFDNINTGMVTNGAGFQNVDGGVIVGGSLVSSIGPNILAMGVEQPRSTISALHLGSVQTKNLFLNTIQSTPQGSNLQMFPNQMITSTAPKNKIVLSNQQLPSKNMKIIQPIPSQMRLSTGQTTRANKQVFVRKIINAQQIGPQSNIQPQNAQMIQINTKKEVNNQLVLQSLAIDKNQNQQLLIQQPGQQQKLFNRNSVNIVRGGSQNSQRKLEEKNHKFLSNQIQTNQYPSGLIKFQNLNTDFNNNGYIISNEQEDEKITINDQGSPLLPINQRYSSTQEFEHSPSHQQNFQQYYMGRNSDPLYQKHSEVLSAMSNTNYFQDQVTTQIQHQKTGGSSQKGDPTLKIMQQWPRKNTQGLQGSIYSSSATSSIEGENNVVLLNESDARQLQQLDSNYIQTQDQGYQMGSNNDQQQQNPQRKFFVKRKTQESPQSPIVNYIQPQQILNNQQIQSSGGSIEQKRNFASTFNPHVEQIGLFDQSDGMQQIRNQQNMLISNKSNSKKVISKNNIKFAANSTQSQGSTNVKNNCESQEEVLAINEEENHDVHDQQPKIKSKKTLQKIKEAQQIADSFDKKGIDNAIVQYQFELADKDEENCFKDLYDTLNEFF